VHGDIDADPNQREYPEQKLCDDGGGDAEHDAGRERAPG
jgi:hypothetical protein